MAPTNAQTALATQSPQDPYAAYGGQTISTAAPPDPYAVYGGQTLSQTAEKTIQRSRYTAPGQGVQEFTQGSPEEKQFLTRFPTAKSIPMPGGPSSEQVNTPYQQAEAARIAEGIRKSKTALKTAAVVGGSIIAPEFVPELAAGAGFIPSAVHLGAEALAAGGGAALGTEVGRGITGEDVLSKEALKESAENAALYGGGQLIGGTAGKALGSIANALRDITTPVMDVTAKGTDLAEEISGGALATEKTVAQNTMQKLSEAESKMHSEFEEGLEKISKTAENVPVRIDGSPMQTLAKDLLYGEKEVPSIVRQAVQGLVPDSEKMAPLLHVLAGEVEDAPAEFSWNEMRAVRQMVGGKIRQVPYGNPIKWDLIQLRNAIDDTMQTAAENASEAAGEANPELAKLGENYKALRGVYAKKINLFNEKAIQTLAEKNPDSVADILIGRSNQKLKNVESLRTLIGEDNMPEVEGSILSKLLHKASDTGVTDIGKFRKSFDNLGPDLQQAVWGENLPKIRAFIDEATASTKAGETNRKLLGYLSHYPLSGYMTVKTFLDMARGADAQKIVEDLGLGAASLVAGRYAPEILAKHGARIANIIENAGRVVSAPAATAVPIGLTQVSNNEEAPEEKSIEPEVVAKVPETGENVDVSTLLDKAAQEHGIPPNILHAQAAQESKLDPNAVSKKGAKGVMQLTDKTAEALGVDSSNTAQNIDGGTRYLRQQHDRFKRWDRALAAYDAGPTRVQKAIEEHGTNWLDFMPPETQKYVHKILREAIK